MVVVGGMRRGGVAVGTVPAGLLLLCGCCCCSAAAAAATAGHKTATAALGAAGAWRRGREGSRRRASLAAGCHAGGLNLGGGAALASPTAGGGGYGDPGDGGAWDMGMCPAEDRRKVKEVERGFSRARAWILAWGLPGLHCACKPTS